MRALAVLAALGASGFASRPLAPGQRFPRERLAAGLTAATGLVVRANELYLEDRHPVGFRDELVGRRVVFTGRASPDAPRDVYRATVRLTPDGAVLAVALVANLTRSALGDDGPLVAEGSRVAFPTRAFGRVQSATVLDLAGPPGGVRDPRRGLSNLLHTGAWHGLERWDLRLDRPVESLVVRLDRATLLATSGARRWAVPFPRAELAPGTGAELTHSPYVPKPLVIWAVDTVRGLPWVGPVPIAWLERKAFGYRDALRRWSWRLGGSRRAPAPVLPGDGEAITSAAPADPADRHWPPPNLRCPLGCESRTEGAWRPASPPWLRALPGAPPAFYRTYVRLDRERPYTHVLMLAMDMRQLELGMQAGVEDPVPLVGPRGDGRIPRRPALLGRVVGAFNGAFKTEHGNYGMVVDHRVLLPPRGRAATVATLDDGRVAMGTWPPNTELPTIVSSLRQNLDPLVADGVENPTRRGLWGFVLGGVENMPTVRSGVCADGHGHMIYVWGEETTARLLGRAMNMAGCTYGMHLDMNPTHAAFHFLRVDDVRARRFQYLALSRGMGSGGDRFLYYTLKDFFYLALRDPTPRPVRDVPWRAAGLPQPPPAWLPALHAATVPLGARTATLTSLALDRVALVAREGRRERGAAPDATALGAAHRGRVLGALEAGTCPAGGARGLFVGGRARQAFAPGSTAVEVGPWGARIVRGDARSPEARDALEGTAVVTRGEVVPGGDARAVARLGFGITADRRAIVVEAEATAAEVGALLRDAGAVDAVLLERGEGSVRAHWTGRGDGVRDAYASTGLFVLAGPEAASLVRLESVLGQGRPAREETR